MSAKSRALQGTAVDGQSNSFPAVGTVVDGPILSLPATAGRRRPVSRRWYVGSLIGLDALALVLGWLVALVADQQAVPIRIRLGSEGLPFSDSQTMLVVLATWVGMMASAGAYGWATAASPAEQRGRSLQGAARFLALAAVAGVLLPGVVRVHPILLLAVVTGAASDLVLRDLHVRAVSRGRSHPGHRRLLVVGAEDAAKRLANHLDRQTGGRFTVSALYTGTRAASDAVLVGLRQVEVLRGDREEMIAALRGGGFDAVAVVTPSVLGPGGLRELAWDLEGAAVDVMIAPDASDVAGPRLQIVSTGGLPLSRLRLPVLAGGAQLAKATVERPLALLGIVVASPLLLGIAVLIKLTSPGPVIFRQTRVGRNGVPFTVYKFRTMVPGAEALLTELEGENESDGALFKIRRDPRITPLGRWLRRLSLDELPQLANVVAGQMSIVGPRPPLPSEVVRYPSELHRRLRVKPGLTGLWQVSGRATLSWEDSMRLDLFYVDNWSLALDLGILARTLQAILGGRGAY